MKVLFTLDSLATGGTEKSTIDIIRHFSPKTEAKVVHFFPGFDLQQEYQKAGIPLIYLNLKGKRNFVRGTMKLIRVIKKEKPDLIVSSIMRANLISRMACKILGVPLVGTFVNDSYGEIRLEEIRQKNQYRLFRFFWLLDKWTSSIPAYYISNSASIAKSNATALGIPTNKMTVIYRGRDTRKFPAWKPIADQSAFRFVFVGRLLQRKGLRELIVAFARVKQLHPEARLDIFGGGEFRKSVEALVKEHHLQDAVILHGSVPDAWKKLYEAHCFMFPSWYEGFSGALVEAMIAGIPIISSDISMNLEAVDNKTALIYPVKDENKLTECMLKMIREYPAMLEMGQRASQSARNRFDIRNIVEQYESFLHKVVTKTVARQDLLS